TMAPRVSRHGFSRAPSSHTARPLCFTTQQNASPALLCRRLKRQVRRERIRHGLSKPKQGGRLLVKKRSFWRFLRKPLKPFEDRCPRIEASWPRLISGVSTCQVIRCRTSDERFG